MKDRIGNTLSMGDKLVVALPEASIFGFVAELKDAGMITGVRGRGNVETLPGRVLVSCVIALPVDQNGNVMQVVKVYDADKHEDGPKVVPN